LENKVLHIRRLKNRHYNTHDLYNGESASIRAWLVERERMNPPAEIEKLFISERRKPMSRITVFHTVRLIAATAGLEHLECHPHMLRHACGYALIQKTDLRVVQDYLGHASISSTTRYTRLDRRRFARLF
jgi:type 1 fimbriae regulatory protein FimB